MRIFKTLDKSFLQKFINRFNYVEAKSKEQGRKLKEMTLAEMDILWDEAKQLERNK